MAMAYPEAADLDPTPGGYDHDFVDPIEPYKCPMCLLVARDPVQTENCGHSFCQSCWQQHVTLSTNPDRCPSDNEQVGRVFVDRSKKRMIDDLNVYCDNRGLGCDCEMELRHVQAHMATCEHRLVSCDLMCGEKVLLRTLPAHKRDQCARRHVTCPLCADEMLAQHMQHHETVCREEEIACQWCHGDLPRKLLSAHLPMCLKCPTYCSFALHGCTDKMERQKLKDHHQTDMYRHVGMLNVAMMGIRDEVGVDGASTETSSCLQYELPGELSHTVERGVSDATVSWSELPGVMCEMKAGREPLLCGRVSKLENVNMRLIKRIAEANGECGKKIAEVNEECNKIIAEAIEECENRIAVVNEESWKRIDEVDEKFGKRFTEVEEKFGKRSDLAIEECGNIIAEVNEESCIRIAKLDEKFGKRFTEVEEKFHKRISEANAECGNRIAEVNEECGMRIDEVDEKFGKKIAEANEESWKKIAEVDEKFGKRIAEVSEECGKRFAEANEKCCERNAVANEECWKRIAEVNKSDKRIAELDEKFGNKIAEVNEKFYNGIAVGEKCRKRIAKVNEDSIAEVKEKCDEKIAEVGEKAANNIAKLKDEVAALSAKHDKTIQHHENVNMGLQNENKRLLDLTGKMRGEIDLLMEQMKTVVQGMTTFVLPMLPITMKQTDTLIDHKYYAFPIYWSIVLNKAHYDTSSSFYTSSGYRMFFNIVYLGNSNGFVIQANVTSGWNDATLSWPFKEKLEMEVRDLATGELVQCRGPHPGDYTSSKKSPTFGSSRCVFWIGVKHDIDNILNTEVVVSLFKK